MIIGRLLRRWAWFLGPPIVGVDPVLVSRMRVSAEDDRIPVGRPRWVGRSVQCRRRKPSASIAGDHARAGRAITAARSASLIDQPRECSIRQPRLPSCPWSQSSTA